MMELYPFLLTNLLETNDSGLTVWPQNALPGKEKATGTRGKSALDHVWGYAAELKSWK